MPIISKAQEDKEKKIEKTLEESVEASNFILEKIEKSIKDSRQVILKIEETKTAAETAALFLKKSMDERADRNDVRKKRLAKICAMTISAGMTLSALMFFTYDQQLGILMAIIFSSISPVVNLIDD